MSTLRRLPWDGPEGKPAYVPEGGHGEITRLADATEAKILTMARVDAKRARSLAEEDSVSPAELRLAVWYLASAVEEAVRVADLRGERLPGLDSEGAIR
ncbi:hypothetical protein [Streptomyces qinglanensis]|uniref:Uncharacterized protein n=1 Tax=Streptomyces qinglanensis TaxID=943816 RepID=A0A1H9NWF8_9ACTN|nr:hypothetical protein [Streptomyces qinglanensis]SER39673.1 hypothetical protein SAMN05421870_101684 [Streptomyces qinglanensis]